MTAQIKMTRKEAEVQMACFRQTFSSVRLLNEKAVLQALPPDYSHAFSYAFYEPAPEPMHPV